MEIIGHTDTAEDPSLAMQRAVATKTYLLAHGLKPSASAFLARAMAAMTSRSRPVRASTNR